MSIDRTAHELESFATQHLDDIATAYYRTVWDRLPNEARVAIADEDEDEPPEVDATLAALRTTAIGKLFYFLEAAVQFFHQPMHFTDDAAVRAFRERCDGELKSLLRELTSR